MRRALASARSWMQLHPESVDTALAVALSVLALIELIAARERVEGPWWGQLFCFLAMTMSVAYRRSAVVIASTVCGAALVLQELLGPAPAVAGFLALLIVLYSAGAYGVGRQGIVALAVLLAALTVYPLTHPSGLNPADLIGNLAIFVGAWGLGRMVRHHRERGVALAAAHAELKARQERDRAAALVAERARIARELHDIVAHAVSLMVLQIGAARAVLDTRAGQAREPLLAAERAGRQALEELQRMLGLLRLEESIDRFEHGETRSPTPDLAMLPELAAQVTASGIDVRLRVVGDEVELASGVSQSAYRIVQEGLTNVIKHAAAKRADVVLTYTDESLRIEVGDDGQPAGQPARGRRAGLPSSGAGLLGLRERVSLYGGTFSAGRCNGGWLLRAELPYGGAS
jgi:signal transduction histidine kinase